MKVGIIKWQKTKKEVTPKLKKADALRPTASQVWNKEGVFRLGYTWKIKIKNYLWIAKFFLERPKHCLKSEQKSRVGFLQTETF